MFHKFKKGDKKVVKFGPFQRFEFHYFISNVYYPIKNDSYGWNTVRIRMVDCWSKKTMKLMIETQPFHVVEEWMSDPKDYE